MEQYRTSKDALTKCELKGSILPQTEIDTDQIISLLELSEGDQQAAEKLKIGLDRKSILWNNVYSLYYDALHKIVDSYLRFDKITSLNHICLFAYLCEKHPELEIDWNFFEKIRTKRNGINYYGQKASYNDWNSIEIQARLYIKMIQEEVQKKLQKD